MFEFHFDALVLIEAVLIGPKIPLCRLFWRFQPFDVSFLDLQHQRRDAKSSFYRTQVSLVRSAGPSLSNLLYIWLDLTDVTLADEDTNSILADNANRPIQGNVAMHVTHPVNLVIKF